MSEKLKPCPFCGHSASIGYFGDFEVTASCDGGDADCPGKAGSCAHFSDDEDQKRQDVIAAWNTRALSSEVRALVEAARALTAKLDLLSDTISSAFFMAYTRMEAEYKGETYGKDLKKLRAALAPFNEAVEKESGE